MKSVMGRLTLVFKRCNITYLLLALLLLLILTGKSTGKRPLERPRRRWKDNNRMDLEGSCECSIEPPGSLSHGISYYYYYHP